MFGLVLEEKHAEFKGEDSGNPGGTGRPFSCYEVNFSRRQQELTTQSPTYATGRYKIFKNGALPLAFSRAR